MARFDNKIVVITGGTTGIGFASAKLIADAGGKVIITGRNSATVEAARKELGDRVEVIQSDAADPRAIASLFAELKERHGAIDALFLNAGIVRARPIEQVDAEQIDQIFNVNVKGPLLAIKHAAPLLRQGASVLITTSVANQAGVPGMSVYAASKAAVRSIVRTAAAELAPQQIRVNAISPGPVETPIWGKTGLSPEELEGMSQNIMNQVPIGRIGQSDEIARAAAFMMSGEASFITGEELVVDGGMAGV